jgi:hypothetical protein
MSPVESWQQLQQEANDITNLRLDQMKQVVTPITKVKRGRQVDMDAVMRRGQDTVVMVTDKDDVEWDRPPDVPPSAMAEGNILNNDFDELAGTFSQSSIQSNRSLNETVGGMNLLNSAANSVTEFDLRVWIETWVEPTLWQVVKLEEYYESDEKILAIAGQRAELVEKYGIDAITDHLLMEDITLRVSAGIGAAAPEQRLGKFSTAADIVGKILLPFIENGSVKARPKADAIVEEVFGIAGYKGAGSRFFDIADPNAPQQPEAAPPPDPAEMAKLQLEAKKHSDTMALKGAELQAKSATTIATIQDKQQERAAKVALQHLKSETELQRQRMDELGQRDRLFTEHAHQARENHVGHALEALMAARAARDAAMEREHSAEQADADRAHQAEQAQAAAKAKAAEPKKAA